MGVDLYQLTYVYFEERRLTRISKEHASIALEYDECADRLTERALRALNKEVRS